MLFAASLRFNIDPLGQASGDAVLWEAVQRAGLKQTLASMPVRPCSAQCLLGSAMLDTWYHTS